MAQAATNNESLEYGNTKMHVVEQSKDKCRTTTKYNYNDYIETSDRSYVCLIGMCTAKQSIYYTICAEEQEILPPRSIRQELTNEYGKNIKKIEERMNSLKYEILWLNADIKTIRSEIKSHYEKIKSLEQMNLTNQAKLKCLAFWVKEQQQCDDSIIEKQIYRDQQTETETKKIIEKISSLYGTINNTLLQIRVKKEEMEWLCVMKKEEI